MILDPTSDIGKIRLRIADYSDLPLLSDSVIVSTLADCNGNLPKAAKICATYVLGMLAHKTHRRMATLEIWGNEAYQSYRDYLLLTVTRPEFMDLSPIPYSANAESNPLLDFQKSWNQNFVNGSEQQQNNHLAALSPNDGSKYGPFGGF
jgi:hypothetical protein